VVKISRTDPGRTAHTPCVVVMKPLPERTTGHARSVSWGHCARLITPAYVKPFVKWQKNDAADAEAIGEAA
jgi:transposase